jgi:hypothetical protein
MPAGVIDWSRAAPGSFEVLRPGGKFSWAFYAPNDEVRVLKTALAEAGFVDIKDIGGVVVTATKP